MDRRLWYVIAGTRGGPTRGRILGELLRQPQNAHQLARRLGLDYKTVEYNLRVLKRHVFVVCPNPDAYGALYFPSKNLEAVRDEFERLAARLPSPVDSGKAPNTAPDQGDSG